jgi:hypothetical protein
MLVVRVAFLSAGQLTSNQQHLYVNGWFTYASEHDNTTELKSLQLFQLFYFDDFTSTISVCVV